MLITINSKFPVLLLLIIRCISYFNFCKSNSFTVDYNNNRFLKDNAPFSYVSGSIHYTRLNPGQWYDRLSKMKAASLDAIETSIVWNAHESKKGIFDFNGELNLVAFIEMAGKNNLLVILRVGPYIDADIDLGGLPAWMLLEGVTLRSSDPLFIFYVDRWFSQLASKINPLIYSNGGPVIMLQIEHQYGSYGRDESYLLRLKASAQKHFSNNVVKFTTDVPNLQALRRGSITGFLSTISFGPKTDVKKAFEQLRLFQPTGPLVNAHLITGYPSVWGEPHDFILFQDIILALSNLIQLGASANMYMFCGGTNFGFTNGANVRWKYLSTSYDYDAPLSEAGDPTDKYIIIRKYLIDVKNSDPIPIPPSTSKANYGIIFMNFYGSIMKPEYMKIFSKSIKAIGSYPPPTMEQFDQSYGYMLYKFSVYSNCSSSKQLYLYLSDVRDRGLVLVNSKLQGVLDETVPIKSLTLEKDCNNEFQSIDIFVENQGRLSSTQNMNHEVKGILRNVFINGDIIPEMTVYSIPLESIDPKMLILESYDGYDNSQYRQFCFYQGQLCDEAGFLLQDSYLYINSYFTKGQAYINGHNIGRYWPEKGTQISLFVPGTLFNKYPKENYITLFEIDNCEDPRKTFTGFLKVPWL